MDQLPKSVEQRIEDCRARYTLTRSYDAARDLAYIYRDEVYDRENALIWSEKAYLCGPRTSESAREAAEFSRSLGETVSASRWMNEARKSSFLERVVADSRFREDFFLTGAHIKASWEDLASRLSQRHSTPMRSVASEGEPYSQDDIEALFPPRP